MSLKIVRNDIVNMDVDAIVNTASASMHVGPGCDSAIYEAAGYEQLLKYRYEVIGERKEGDAFITPGFNLKAKYIIHTVSPRFSDGNQEEEAKLRSCYVNALNLAKENNISSIAFPLISTGCFGCPKEDGLRIAIEEITSFLIKYNLEVYIVVFGREATSLGLRIDSELKTYIDDNYVEEKIIKEGLIDRIERKLSKGKRSCDSSEENIQMIRPSMRAKSTAAYAKASEQQMFFERSCDSGEMDDYDFDEEHENKLQERISHLQDTFSQYLLYIIERKGMSNAEVYKRAIVDKKTFSKIKNNPDYHPQKITAMCLCVGARLNMDETRDLLARAGYALSPCDKTDIIFSYFIENQIYDMIELDIQLEEHGLDCIIA